MFQRLQVRLSRGKFRKRRSRIALNVLPTIVVVAFFATLAAAQTQYVITNDDPGVSFYSVGQNGALTLLVQVQIGGFGNVAGFFGANRIAVLDDGSQQCVYASSPSSGQITGISISSLSVAGSAGGSPTDSGSANGIGLALNSQYLYASFTASNTIGTFSVQAGCGLSFISDVAVSGLAGGLINGMAIQGALMIVSYTDGSIQSFNISSGTPIANSDEQYSTATLTSQDATYPNSIDITSDSHFAIFGDTSTSDVIEVSDLSSGQLTPTIVYSSKKSISSSNIMLSPDQTLLYVINTQGATVMAMHFNGKTGVLSPACISPTIRGESADWSYLSGVGFISQTGNGGGIYVAEFGAPSSIALVSLTSSGAKCSLQEVPQSPFADPNSQGLLSIGTFPPRQF
jgi:6-phosphogluconolactonase (cycloisomerase 2 family)